MILSNGFGSLLFNKTFTMETRERLMENMKLNKKNNPFVEIRLLVVFGVFAVGVLIGIGITYNLYKPDLSTEAYVQAMSLQSALEKIDKNEIAKGHYLVKANLAGYILTMDSLVNDEKDVNLKRQMESILCRIARHRDRFPQNYLMSEKRSSEVNGGDQIIADTLKKYKK